jgi:hypothetical protein
MVKMRYSFKISSHLQFLEKYMPQKNKDEVKNKPSLFGNVTLEEYKQRITGKHFKFIISPESDKIPLESFTRAWIEKAEQQLGYKFVWQAVIHKDTGHPHVHILINGNDMNGRYIKKIPQDFIKNQSHIIASEIATSMIGPRSTEEITLANARTIEADRFTNYDQQILEQSTPIEDGRFALSLRPVTDALKKRLSHLRELNLAEYDADSDRYKLEKDFADKLHFAGRYNSFLQARNKLQFTLPENLTLYTADAGKITGTVREVYRMNDEDVWNNAVVVENEQLHKAWYVPLFNPPSNKIKEGGSIELNEYTNSKGLLVPGITLLDACGNSEKPGGRRGKHPDKNGYSD